MARRSKKFLSFSPLAGLALLAAVIALAVGALVFRGLLRTAAPPSQVVARGALDQSRLTPGAHTLTFQGQESAGEPVELSQPFTVGADETPTPSPSLTPLPPPTLPDDNLPEPKDAHITYNVYDANQRAHLLKYADSASGAWVSETVAAGSRSWPIFNKMAIDKNERVHLISVILSGQAGELVEFKYASNASGAWTSETIGSAGKIYYRGMALAVDGNGKVHVAHAPYPSSGAWSQVQYTTNASGSWVTTTIDSGNIARSYKIGSDTSGNVHIVYAQFNGSNWILKHATNSQGSWSINTIEQLGEYAGPFSMSVDSEGNVHVAHISTSTRLECQILSCSWVAREVLRYASNDSGSWVDVPVGQPHNGRLIRGLAIAVDPLTDQVHITRIGGVRHANEYFKYVKNGDGTWVEDQAGTLALAGRLLSTALTRSGQLHVVTFDSIQKSLLHGTDAVSPFTSGVVDSNDATQSIDSVYDDSVNLAVVEAL